VSGSEPHNSSVEALSSELAQLRDQQAATNEVLLAVARSDFELQPIFETVVEQAIRLCKADAGQIFVKEGDHFRLACAAGGSEEYRSLIGGRQLPLGPGTLVGRVALEGRPVMSRDIAHDREYDTEEQHLRQRLGGFRTIVGVPIQSGDEVIAVISLWRREVNLFQEREIELATTFAAQGEIAIRNASLMQQLDQQATQLAEWNRELQSRVEEQVAQIDRMGRLKRFLSPQLAELMVSSGDESFLESHRCEITVVFCDLRGFTAFAEMAEPEETMTVLSQYHETLGELVFRFGGTLERFTGDGLMVFFNDPVPCPDPAIRSVQMGAAMQNDVAGLAERWRRSGHDLGFSIGIAQGYATLGRVGFEGRFDYAAIGTVTNLAARLCDVAEPGKMLVSQRVHAGVEDLVLSTEVRDLQLKGFSRPITAFEIVGLNTDLLHQ